MTAVARQFASFDAAFAMAFEEEVSGETFFAALAETEADPLCAALWEKLSLIENRTIAALRPLAEDLGLTPADEASVRKSGHDEASDWRALPFSEVMTIMVRDYPAYVVEFTNLLARAPDRAKPAAQLLIDHETAIIDMARAYLRGDAPVEPLDAYLAYLSTWTAERGQNVV